MLTYATVFKQPLNQGDAHYDVGALDVRGLNRIRNGAITIRFTKTLAGTITMGGNYTVRDGVTFSMDSGANSRSLTIDGASRTLTLGGAFGASVATADPLRSGQWVRPEPAPVGVASADRRRVTAFIAADDLAGVELGASARFISDDPAAPALALRLDEIAAANADALDIPMLLAARGD